MTKDLTIGLDIGGTKMAFVLADRQGDIHHRTTLPTCPSAGFSDTISRISRQLNALIARYDRVRAIGIGLPGPVDSGRGLAIRAVNLGWKNIRIRDLLAQGLGRALPVYVDNDVNAGALGEQLFGVAAGIANFVYLAIGTGFGGAAVINNQLLPGAANAAMEIGHVSLDPVNGRRCACGLRGCLETSASGSGIVAHARARIVDFPESRLKHGAITTREIIKLAADGDELAALVMSEAAEALGIASALCLSLFNPKMIIFAGGLLHASWHLLEEPTLRATQGRCLPVNFNAVTFARSTLTDGALGASALAWRRLKQSEIT
jgi:glucokinase